MAKIDIARMKVGVDFDVNKNSIDPILKTLQQISLLSKASGNSLNEGLKEAGKTAEKVSSILEKSFSKSNFCHNNNFSNIISSKFVCNRKK